MEKQIIVNNLLISYLQTEGDKNIPVLFLHGWRSQKEVWGDVIKRIRELEKERVSCYALDLPGFGKSQLPKQVMTVGDYSDSVAEFIKKLDLRQVVIIGHSFGGRIGIKLASTHPELVSKLVLADSAGFRMRGKKEIIYNFVAAVLRPLFRPKFMQGLRKKLYGIIGAGDYVATPELRETFLNVINEDLSQDMGKITCPTLIVTGENDLDTPVEYGKRMNALIRNSQLKIILNAVHFSFLDQPAEFVPIISKFIN